MSFARDYQPLTISKSMASSPRFGHPRDFALLFSGDTNEVSDYLYGLLFVGCLTLCIFVTWGFLLCIFRCLGARAVGFLSGEPFTFDGVNPEDQQEINEELMESDSPESWRPTDKPEPKKASNMYRGNEPEDESGLYRPGESNRARRFSRRNKAIRVTFILSAMIYVTFAILAVTKGTMDLQNTINTLNQNSDNIDAISKEARDIIQTGLRDTAALAQTIRSKLRVELNAQQFCPADPEIVNSDIGKDIFAQSNDALQLLDALDNFRLDSLTEVESALDSIEKGTEKVYDTSGEVDLLGWEAVVVMLPYVIVPSIFIAACIMAWFDVSLPLLNKCINWFLLPLFIVMTFVAIVVASGMIMGAGVNSDFCLPGGRESTPDQTVLRITEEYGFAETTVYDVISWYVSQCTSGDPFVALREYQPELESSLQSVNLLDASLQEASTIEELALYCNRDFEPIEAIVASMKDILGILARSLVRALSLVSCDTVVPIYTSTVYDGTCTYSMSAVFWIFSCAVLLSVTGLIMITFRSAYKQDIYAEELCKGTENVEGADDTPEEESVEEIEPMANDSSLVQNDSIKSEARGLS